VPPCFELPADGQFEVPAAGDVRRVRRRREISWLCNAECGGRLPAGGALVVFAIHGPIVLRLPIRTHGFLNTQPHAVWGQKNADDFRVLACPFSNRPGDSLMCSSDDCLPVRRQFPNDNSPIHILRRYYFFRWSGRILFVVSFTVVQVMNDAPLELCQRKWKNLIG
jgi:hypothetical protein